MPVGPVALGFLGPFACSCSKRLLFLKPRFESFCEFLPGSPVPTEQEIYENSAYPPSQITGICTSDVVCNLFMTYIIRHHIRIPRKRTSVNTYIPISRQRCMHACAFLSRNNVLTTPVFKSCNVKELLLDYRLG